MKRKKYNEYKVSYRGIHLECNKTNQLVFLNLLYVNDLQPMCDSLLLEYIKSM
jgi:hypothetical protein